MYKRLLIVTFTVIGLCTLLICLPIHGEAEIYDSVLRLHVIANSDSEEDQALKLKVRDAILEKTKEIFCGCTTREEARKKVEENTRGKCSSYRNREKNNWKKIEIG